MAAKKSDERPQEGECDREPEVAGMPKGWRPGQLIVIPLEPDLYEFPESRMDFTIPFWVGTPVE